jgi:hypothetical protein
MIYCQLNALTRQKHFACIGLLGGGDFGPRRGILLFIWGLKMGAPKLTHRRTTALSYAEARMVDKAASDRHPPVSASALIREILKAALEPDGTEPRK